MYQHNYSGYGSVGPDRKICACGHTNFMHMTERGCLCMDCACLSFTDAQDPLKYRDAIDREVMSALGETR